MHGYSVFPFFMLKKSKYLSINKGMLDFFSRSDSFYFRFLRV
ncbi:hypothetical protein BH23BAC3_BH23BAC3_19230 [soil metagenome]